MYNGIINDFAFDYADSERAKLIAYKTVGNFNTNFFVSDALFDELVAYAEKNKVHKNEKEIKLSKRILKNQLKALILAIFGIAKDFILLYKAKTMF